MAIEPKTITDVDDYLTRWRPSYIELLQKVHTLLKELLERRDFRGLVHRVYTRADRQHGDPIKARPKIARALHNLKMEDQNNRPANVPDIVGLTIVCPYPSDVDEIYDKIKLALIQRGLRVSDPKKMERPTYIATHVMVHETKAHIEHIGCEIQIKTMLHDAWDAKTHDLTYKPEIRVGKNLKMQMEKIFKVLHSIDEQSEVIKNHIMEQEVLDRFKRRTTRRSLIKRLDSGGEADERHTKLLAVLKSIQEQEESLSRGHDGEVEQLRQLKDLAQECVDKNLLRVLAYLASLLDRPETDSYVIEQLEEWLSKRDDGQERIDALKFKAVVMLTLDRVAEAYETSERTLQHFLSASPSWPQDGALSTERQLGLNVAYYIAELCQLVIDEDRTHEKRARELVEQYFVVPDGADGSHFDTVGLVLITFGCTRDEIVRGWGYCRKTLDLIPDGDERREQAQAFVDLHELRAFTRLAALLSAPKN